MTISDFIMLFGITFYFCVSGGGYFGKAIYSFTKQIAQKITNKKAVILIEMLPEIFTAFVISLFLERTNGITFNNAIPLYESELALVFRILILSSLTTTFLTAFMHRLRKEIRK